MTDTTAPEAVAAEPARSKEDRHRLIYIKQRLKELRVEMETLKEEAARLKG